MSGQPSFGRDQSLSSERSPRLPRFSSLIANEDRSRSPSPPGFNERQGLVPSSSPPNDGRPRSESLRPDTARDSTIGGGNLSTFSSNRSGPLLKDMSDVGKPGKDFKIGFGTPIIMISLFLVGIVMAGLNHFMYSFLNNKLVTFTAIPPNGIFVIAVAFAFAYKASMIGSMTMAYNQGIWYLFRQNSLRASNIDHLFNLPNNPFHLLNIRLAFVAPLGWFMGLLMWILPLAAIVAPGSMSVAFKDNPKNATLGVPTLPATSANTGFPILSGADQTYAGPTIPFSKFVAKSVLNRNIIPWPSTSSSDCTYQQIFEGFAYECQDGSLQANKNTIPNLGAKVPYKSQEAIGPDGDFRFWLGFFQNGANNFIMCDPVIASYNISVEYKNDVQKVTVNRVGKVQTLSHNNLQGKGLDSAGWANLNNVAIKDAFQEILLGNISVGKSDKDLITSKTTITLTDLATINEDGTLSISPDVIFLLNQMSQNVTLSAISLNADNAAAVPEASAKTPVLSLFPGSYFFYRYPILLLASYGVGALFAAVLLAVGLFALYSNGVSGDRGFLQLVCTTRNQVLDDLSMTGSLGGGSNIPISLYESKLKFGEVVDDETAGFGARHVGFGTDPQIMPIRKSWRKGRYV